MITVSNSADSTLLSEQLLLYSEQAISLWQQYLARFDQDALAVNVHFALGLLYARSNETAKAIAEFRMVANRFSRSALLPYAMFNSSMLRTNIKDYRGARDDLLGLVEQHPQSEIADEAIFYLADATMKASLFNEARPLYKKLYDLNLSPQSQLLAAFSLGCCSFEEKEYEESIKWLTTYLNLAKNNTDSQRTETQQRSGQGAIGTGVNIYRAYLLIGKAYFGLNKPDEACTAFQYALAGKHSPEEYVLIISALVDSYIAREKLVEALAICDRVEAWQFSQKENFQILLLKAKVLRQMGMIERAIATIGERADFVGDLQLKAEILYELALCYKAGERFDLARRNLTEILSIGEKGTLLDEASVELAEVCRIQGRSREAVTVCIGILNSEPKDEIKKRALSILAEAYRSQKDYDNALLALMGKWKTANR